MTKIVALRWKVERSWYLCGIELLKRVFLDCRLYCWKLFIRTKHYCLFISLLDTRRGSIYGVSLDTTLGDGATAVLCIGIVIGAVDGSRVFGIVSVTGCYIFSTILVYVASTRRALRTGLLVFSNGLVYDGVCDNTYDTYYLSTPYLRRTDLYII